MATFDRFDIAEAHLAFCDDHHDGQWSATYKKGCRIRRFLKPGHLWMGFDSLTENGKEIYRALQARYGFKVAK